LAPLARVFAVADVFDALTSRRPYKPALLFEDAWKILERAQGAHFDAVLLDAFRRISGGVHARVANRSDDEQKALLAEVKVLRLNGFDDAPPRGPSQTRF
jgi:HD-GYP domain-containing protein (c-di-GMP phosphodiesterase class II)